MSALLVVFSDLIGKTVVEDCFEVILYPTGVVV